MNEDVCRAGEGLLQSYLDGELPTPDERRVEKHLQECPWCSDDLADLRGASAAFARAVEALDRPDAGAPTRRRHAWRTRTGSGGWTALPRAAALIVGFAAAAAAAVPGSPVREWVQSLWSSAPEAAVQQAARPSAAGDTEADAGVSVTPEAGAVHVVITGARPGLVVTAALSEGPRAGVYASGPAASARFRTGPGLIEVSGASAGVLRVEIPVGVEVAGVVVGGARYIEKDGNMLRFAGGGEASSGQRVTFTVR